MLSKLLDSVSLEEDDIFADDSSNDDITFSSFDSDEDDDAKEVSEISCDESEINTRLNQKSKKDLYSSVKTALQTNIYQKEKTDAHLYCHPESEMPLVISRVAGKCFHIECCKCSSCKKQITSPSASVISERPFTLLCNECAEDLERETILCPICHQAIDEDDETETLRANYTCHIACMHCCMCSRTYKEVQTFEVLEFGGVPYCMCHDCADFITRSNIPSLNLSGRIPAKILKENNYVCDSCNGKLKGRFFFFSNGSILCKSCASP